MVLITQDPEGVRYRHEVEASFDVETKKLVDLNVVAVIKAHEIAKAWVETPVRHLGIEMDGPRVEVGSCVTLNDPKIHEFYMEYEC